MIPPQALVGLGVLRLHLDKWAVRDRDDLAMLAAVCFIGLVCSLCHLCLLTSDFRSGLVFSPHQASVNWLVAVCLGRFDWFGTG